VIGLGLTHKSIWEIPAKTKQSSKRDGNIQMSSDKNRITKVERIMIGLGRKHLALAIISMLVMATFGIIQLLRAPILPQKQSILQAIAHNGTTPKTSGSINNATKPVQTTKEHKTTEIPLTNGKAETTKPTREDSIMQPADDKEKTTKTKRAAPHKPADSVTSPSAQAAKGGAERPKHDR
jgi:hypothetical protein